MVLAAGSAVDITGGGRVMVGQFLGEGGQAYVFEARDHVGNRYALKWFKNPTRLAYDTLAGLIDDGPPSPRFLWPLALATQPGRAEFGYLMPLRPPEYLELRHLMNGVDSDGRPVTASTAAVITACYQLSREFLRLHARGLCYRDINFGNIFLVPATGETLICDNDNVGVDGSPGEVAGSMGFMAPEVVRLHFGATNGAPPSARTDRHSLAVTLFYLLFVAHPLEGKKCYYGLDDDAWKLEHYGTDALFLFDPRDDRNRPVEETTVKYWEHYPQFLRELFIEAFGPGLQDPNARVTEGIWSTAMLRLRDATASCDSCRGVIFIDWDDTERACVRCAAPTATPRSIQIGVKRVVVGPHTRIWTDHFGGDPDASAPVGEMTTHPNDPTRWGLRNLTPRPWTATGPDGRLHEVMPGRAIDCQPETRIQFGLGHGTVAP